MNMEEVLNGWQLNGGASLEAIGDAASSLGVLFPPDYIEFLRECDGGEGVIGENYLILWKASELDIFNREYEVAKYAPGLLLFGSDGGGEGYGFDMRDPLMPVVRVPFIGMELRYVRAVASSFAGMFEQLLK
jgi:SMI1 / KNR4 family (SUKH-1)